MRLIVGTAAAIVLVGGCAPSVTSPTAARTDTAPPATVPRVEYEVVDVREQGAQRWVTVEASAAADLEQVFAAVRDDHRDEGGWFVAINCPDGTGPDGDLRLANGRYAVGDRGAAATGLDEGEAEFTTTDRDGCP